MKKHTKQIISGVLLFILGAIVIPTIFCIIAFMYVLSNKPLAKFIIPEQAIVTIEREGRYYLWNDYQTIFEGHTYSCSANFPIGLDISLLEKINGTAVKFVPDQSIISSTGNSHKSSIGYFEVSNPGTYILSVLGQAESRVCSFGTSIFNLKNVLIFLGTFGVTMLTGIGGFVLIIIGIVNLAKAKKKPLDAGSSPV